jgi:hypothetical protein
MNSNQLTKSLGLLVGIEWGVRVNFNPPFLTGIIKNQPFKIHCESVSHIDGYIKRIKTDSDTTNFMVLILNKSGNNLVMLSSNTTKKLLTKDVSMRELASGIIYKNEIEYEANIPS